jgi:hypothetical protein
MTFDDISIGVRLSCFASMACAVYSAIPMAVGLLLGAAIGVLVQWRMLR